MLPYTGLHNDHTGHCIITTKLRSCIWNYEYWEFRSATVTLGGGFFVGITIGYALKKVIKIVAVIVGLFLAGLAYLQYHQIANINWNKLQQVLSEGVLQHFQMRLLYRFQVLVMVVVPIFMPCNSLLICDDQLGIPLTGSMPAGFTTEFIKDDRRRT